MNETKIMIPELEKTVDCICMQMGAFLDVVAMITDVLEEDYNQATISDDYCSAKYFLERTDRVISALYTIHANMDGFKKTLDSAVALEQHRRRSEAKAEAGAWAS